MSLLCGIYERRAPAAGPLDAMRGVLPSNVCWRLSKSNPARVRTVDRVLAGVLSVVRRHLDARSEPPSRAKYVDMPRLLAQLGTDSLERVPQPGKLQAALHSYSTARRAGLPDRRGGSAEDQA